MFFVTEIRRSWKSKKREPMTEQKTPDKQKAIEDAILFLAQMKQNEELLIEQVKRLEKLDKKYLCQVFSSNVGGWTLFHAFALRGARKLMKIALRCGVDTNLRMGQPDNIPGGCTSLHLAAYRGDVSIIQLLLQNDADINQKDYSEHAPIYYAAMRGNTLAVRKLLKQGADISDLDKEQRHLYLKETFRRSSSLLCLKSALL